MRHFRLPGAVTTLACGMGVTARQAGLIALPRRPHRGTSRRLRTGRTAVALAAVTVAANQELTTTAGTVAQTRQGEIHEDLRQLAEGSPGRPASHRRYWRCNRARHGWGAASERIWRSGAGAALAPSAIPSFLMRFARFARVLATVHNRLLKCCKSLCGGLLAITSYFGCLYGDSSQWYTQVAKPPRLWGGSNGESFRASGAFSPLHTGKATGRAGGKVSVSWSRLDTGGFPRRKALAMLSRLFEPSNHKSRTHLSHKYEY